MHTPERKKKTRKKKREKKRRMRATNRPQRTYHRPIPASIRNTAAYQADAQRRAVLRGVERMAKNAAWWATARGRDRLPGFPKAASDAYQAVVRSVCPHPDPRLRVLEPHRLIVRVHRSDRDREDTMMRICGIPRERAARYLRRALHDLGFAIASFCDGGDATIRG